jgi:hypothetical protein
MLQTIFAVIPVTQVGLQRSGVVTVIRQLIALSAQLHVVIVPITGASCSDTSECNIRSCARLVRLELPLPALEHHLEHRM